MKDMNINVWEEEIAEKGELSNGNKGIKRQGKSGVMKQ